MKDPDSLNEKARPERSARVDIVTVKAPKSHKDQQAPVRRWYVYLSKALISIQFQLCRLGNERGCFVESNQQIPSASISQSSPPAGPITLTAFSNNPLPAGSAGFMATAVGSGFTQTTAVFWNGTELSTSYQTSQILNATVPATLLVQPGTASVYVKDTSAGTISNTMTFAILSPAAATAGVVQMVSSAPDGSPANGDTAIQPSISATGRFVVFQSAGTNLAPQQIITPWANIYMADTCIGATATCTPSVQLISVSADGTRSWGNGHTQVFLSKSGF